MATELMKNWIVELHNPDRVQTKGYLGRQDEDGERSNCCLGVLCEVRGDEGVLREDEYKPGMFTVLYDGASGLPTSEVINDLLGINDDYSGTLKLYNKDDDGYQYAVTADEANDTYDLSFTQIAEKLIEKYLDEDEAFEVRKAVEDKGWA